VSANDSGFAAFADAAIADWPDYALSGEFDAAIESLYRSRLPFPPSWPHDRCEEFISEHAAADADALRTTFDDLVDIVIDRYGRDYGVRLHSEDAAELIDAERRAALDEFERRLSVELPADIAEAAVHGLRRGAGNMTACRPAQRRGHRGR
jgi:hypothetical protein